MLNCVIFDVMKLQLSITQQLKVDQRFRNTEYRIELSRYCKSQIFDGTASCDPAHWRA